MSEPRLVSVIIGTRNRPDLLRQALASIRAVEGPDLRFEILVGDNGTTPETPAVVAEFGGIYDRTEIYGCPAARNLALRRASGEFVAFLDDDDVWLANHIRPHIALLDARPELAAAIGQTVPCTDQLERLGSPGPEQWPTNDDIFLPMMSGFFPQVGGTVVRGAIARAIGLMDESLIGDSDWDWQLRFVARHKVGFVREPCVLCRSRPRGSFDKLHASRAPYTMKIFTRHARANLARWSTPLALAQSLLGVRMVYYDYFAEAAIDRAAAGEWARARRASLRALWFNPAKTVKELSYYSTLRKAVSRAWLPMRRRGVGASVGSEGEVRSGAELHPKDARGVP